MKSSGWKLAGLAVLVIALGIAVITTQYTTKLNEKAATCQGLRTDYIWSVTYKDPLCNQVVTPSLNCSNTNLNQKFATGCKNPISGVNDTQWQCKSIQITTQIPCPTGNPPVTPPPAGSSCSGACFPNSQNPIPSSGATNCGAWARVSASGTCGTGQFCCGGLAGGSSNPKVVSCGQQCTNFDTCRTGQVCAYLTGPTCGNGSSKKYCVKTTGVYSVANCTNKNSLSPADTKVYFLKNGQTDKNVNDAQASCSQ